MSTTVNARNSRADTSRPDHRRRFDRRILVLLGLIAAAIAVTVVLLRYDSSPKSTSPQIARHPQVGVGNMHAPAGPIGPLQCAPAHYVHAC